MCAGSIASPCLLERSGIGNPRLLQKLGIDTLVLNDNVGENLHDHVLTGVSFQVEERMPTLDEFRDPAKIQEAMEQYTKDGSGPLGSGSPSFAYMPLLEGQEQIATNPTGSNDHTGANGSTNQTFTETAKIPFTTRLDNYVGPNPNATERVVSQLLTSPNEPSASLAMVKVQCHLTQDSSDKRTQLTAPGNYITISVCSCHPLSRGSVHSVSASPLDKPIIDPRYYSHPLNIELVARHLQFLPKIISTKPLADMIKTDGLTISADAKFNTLEDTIRIAKSSCMSMQHPCGSCAMLTRDKGGVVDTRLRVYGVEGLMVCDASVFPLIPRGTLMCMVYAVAERAADLIKEDFGRAK